MTTIPSESITTSVRRERKLTPEKVAQRQTNQLKSFEQQRYCNLINSFYENVEEGEWFAFETDGRLRLCQNIQSQNNDSRRVSRGKIAETHTRTELISILSWLRNKLPVDSPIQHRITNILALTTPARSNLIKIISEGLLAIGHIFSTGQ